MRKAKLNEYRKLYYSPDSAPCLNTLREQIRREALPGGFIEDGHYWIDLDAHDRAYGVGAILREKQKVLAGNPVLAGLI